MPNSILHVLFFFQGFTELDGDGCERDKKIYESLRRTLPYTHIVYVIYEPDKRYDFALCWKNARIHILYGRNLVVEKICTGFEFDVFVTSIRTMLQNL